MSENPSLTQELAWESDSEQENRELYDRWLRESARPQQVLADAVNGIVGIFVDPDACAEPQALRSYLGPGRPADGYDIHAGWVAYFPGADLPPLVRLQMDWPEPVPGHAEILFDLREHAQALDLVARGALTTIAHVGEGGEIQGFSLPEIPLAGLAWELVCYASDLLSEPPSRSAARMPGQLQCARWARSPSIKEAERHTRRLASLPVPSRLRPGDTVGEAVLERMAIGAAHAGAPRLAQAIPVVIEQEDVRGLPAFASDLDAHRYALHARLVLPVIYLDLTAPDGQPLALARSAGQALAPLPLHGALIWQSGDERDPDLHIVPYGAPRAGGPVCEPLCEMVFCSELPQTRPAPASVYSNARDVILPAGINAPAGSAGYGLKAELIHKGISHRLEAALSVILSCLYLMEAHNVTVVPAKLSGKQAKLARRKGQEPARVLYVTDTRAERRAGEPGEGRPLKGHHIVRGNYAMYSPLTRIGGADPEKLSYVPERDGYYRKVWRRPHMRGNASGPLVARTRLWRLKG